MLELTYTTHDLAPFARDLGHDGPPFAWDPERRFQLRAELDAAFFHLYGLPREDVDYVMDTFHVVRQQDIAAHGRYRTKEVILEVYGAMAEAIRTGVPYVTKLDPPPANGWVPPALEANGEWRTANGEGAGESEAGVATGGRRGSRRVAARHLPPAAPGQGTLDVEQDALAPGDWVTVDGRGGLLMAVAQEHGNSVFTVLLEDEETERRFVSPPAEVRRA